MKHGEIVIGFRANERNDRWWLAEEISKEWIAEKLKSEDEVFTKFLTTIFKAIQEVDETGPNDERHHIFPHH